MIILCSLRAAVDAATGQAADIGQAQYLYLATGGPKLDARPNSSVSLLPATGGSQITKIRGVNASGNDLRQLNAGDRPAVATGVQRFGVQGLYFASALHADRAGGSKAGFAHGTRPATACTKRYADVLSAI